MNIPRSPRRRVSRRTGLGLLAAAALVAGATAAVPAMAGSPTLDRGSTTQVAPPRSSAVAPPAAVKDSAVRGVSAVRVLPGADRPPTR